MPNLNEAFPSNWLKIDKNVKHGDIIKFLDEGEVVQNGVNDKGQARYSLNITVEVQRTGDIKTFSVNTGNRKIVQALYGADTKNWVGKEMEVMKVRVRSPKGESVDSIELVQPNHRADGSVVHE